MRKNILIFPLMILSFTIYCSEIRVERSLEESITKDYDQDGVYSSYEKALRRTQGSVYVTLPEKRGYWYTMLDRIKAEEDELIQEEKVRMKMRKR